MRPYSKNAERMSLNFAVLRRGTRIAAIALLLGMACLVSPQDQPARALPAQRLAAPAKAISEERFDMRVFGLDRTAHAARQRLETSLSDEVAEIDRACALSPAQKYKLLLMGRGDIKRIFVRYETLKVAFVTYGQNDEEISEDIAALQIILRSGLFHGDSLLAKLLPKALTGEQLGRYDALIRNRLRLRHEAAIEQAVTILDQGSPFSDEERRNFIAFLNKEIRPSPISGDYDYFYIWGQLERLPKEKVKPLLNEAQWFRLNECLVALRSLEPGLRKAGYFRGEDDEDEKPDLPTTAPKK